MTSAKNYLNIRDFLSYLQSLPESTVDELFSYPAACLVIYRELPVLAQQYVMRLLYVEQQVHQSVIESWVSKSHIKDHIKAKDILSTIKVWRETILPGGLPGWVLHEKYRHNLKIGLLGGGRQWTQTSAANPPKPLEPDPKAKTIKDLDAYALNRWEALLQYLTEKQQQTDTVSNDTIFTLTHSHLMEASDRGGSPSITNEGFQFLLLDTSSQVWYFIQQYLDYIIKSEENYGLNLSECIAFICSISLGVLGSVYKHKKSRLIMSVLKNSILISLYGKISKDYSSDGIDPHLQILIQHLREFGLLYLRSRKAGRFYPTRLALNICSKNNKVSLDTEKHKTGFIVLETNYRLYAYTDSELQLALVGMFTDFLFRFPNLAVGVVSRDSVRQALRSGITGDQIITFIKMHIHPEMIKTATNPSNAIPPTIIDQIRLWELERNRLKFTECALYSQFLSQRDFELVKDYAQDIGGFVHGHDQKRTVAVLINNHDDVKRFWKKQSKPS